MANPQPTDAHLRISHKITKELLRRNFSKQQMNILDFILRLSWGCGKPSAYVPEKKQFRLCGVSEKHIAEELRQLEQMRVLLIEEKAGFYQIQKDYDRWQVSPVKAWSEADYDALVSMNISTKTPDLRDKLPESGNNSPNMGQTPRFLTGGYSPKRRALGRKKLCGIRLRGFSIKKDLYNKKNILLPLLLQPRAKENNIFQIFEQEFGRPFSPFENEQIVRWLDEDHYPEFLILEALKEAVLAAKVNFKYIDRILVDWGKANIRSLRDLQQYQERRNATYQPNRQQHLKVVNGSGSSASSQKAFDRMSAAEERNRGGGRWNT